MNEHDLIARGFVKESDGSWRKPKHKAGGVASSPVSQPSAVDEPVAEDAREAVHQVRRLVRITSFRSKLADTDNLFVKHFVDACKEAGLIVDDSPRWCQIEVHQIREMLERTEIEIIPL